MIRRPWPYSAPCSLDMDTSAPGKGDWMAPACSKVESKDVQGHVASLGSMRRLETALSNPSQVIHRRQDSFFLCPFLGGLPGWNGSAFSVCGCLKTLPEENGKKGGNSSRGRVQLSTQHDRLLPPSPHPPRLPAPPAGCPPPLTFSHMLSKSETVIKAISNVYSGDVRHKAETWYLLLTDKWNVLAVAGWGRDRGCEAGESLLLLFHSLI